MITVTFQSLKKLRACQDGMKRFREGHRIKCWFNTPVSLSEIADGKNSRSDMTWLIYRLDDSFVWYDCNNKTDHTTELRQCIHDFLVNHPVLMTLSAYLGEMSYNREKLFSATMHTTLRNAVNAVREHCEMSDMCRAQRLVSERQLIADLLKHIDKNIDWKIE